MAIRVEFHGICTHVKRDESAGTGELPTPHRVILVDSEEGMTLDGQDIPKHVPILRISKKDVCEENPLFPGGVPPNDDGTCYWWNLGKHGMKALAGDPAHGVGYSYRWATAMPRIRSFIPGFRVLPRIVVEAKQHVATVVDVDAGVFDVICRKEASGALLTIPTAGGRAQLKIWRLDDGRSSTICVSDEAYVVVEHAEESPVSPPGPVQQPPEGPHFLLHYLIGGKERIPHHAAVYTTPCRDTNEPRPCSGAGVGLGAFCSNTDYP
jgi:hypothetical protein